MALSLDQLEVFLAVVDAGSFRAAARRLRRTQSSVSYAVAGLERALGWPLFTRTGARPVLTSAGEAAAAQGRVVLGEAHRLAEHHEPALPARPRAPLAILVDAMVAPRVLVPMLLEATRRLPEMELRVRTEARFSLLELLADGTGDVGLSGSSGGVPVGLTREPLRTFALVPVAARDHPLVRAPRLDRTLLGTHLQVALTERSEVGRGRPIENAAGPRLLRVTELPLKLELLRAGLGWGFMPLDFVEDDLRSGRLVQLSVPRPDVGTLSLIYRTRTGPTPFGELIRERLAPRSRPHRHRRTAPPRAAAARSGGAAGRARARSRRRGRRPRRRRPPR